MKLTITNKGDEAEAIVAPDGTYASVLEAGSPVSIINDQDVLVIGDKPDLRDQFESAAQTLAKVGRAIYEAIINRKNKAVDDDEPEIVSVQISNGGTDGVRCILGDGVTDETLEPGETLDLQAVGYIELRELGHAAGQGGTPD